MRIYLDKLPKREEVKYNLTGRVLYDTLKPNERNKIFLWRAFAYKISSIDATNNRRRSWGPIPQALRLFFAALLGELLECLDAQSHDQDTTQHRDSDGNDGHNSTGHITGDGGQSTGQSSNNSTSFHTFLLSYQLITHRAKADIILLIKLAKIPRNRPRAKPDTRTTVLSSTDIPQKCQTYQRTADQKRTEQICMDNIGADALHFKGKIYDLGGCFLVDRIAGQSPVSSFRS